MERFEDLEKLVDRNTQLDWYLSGIQVGVAKSLLMCMNAQKCVDAFDLSFESDYRLRSFIVSRLSVLIENDSTVESAVLSLVKRLVESEGSIAKNRLQTLDRIFGRLIALLSPLNQRDFLLPNLEHSRQLRRTIAYSIIQRNYAIGDKATLLSNYQQHGDEKALEVLASSDTMPGDNARFVLSHLTNTSSQARLFENWIREDHEAAITARYEYPSAFVWALGRLADNSLAQFAIELVLSERIPVRDLSLAAWSLGKMNAVSELLTMAESLGLSLPFSID